MGRPGPNDFRSSKRAKQTIRWIEAALWFIAVVVFIVAMQSHALVRQQEQQDAQASWLKSHPEAGVSAAHRQAAGIVALHPTLPAVVPTAATAVAPAVGLAKARQAPAPDRSRSRSRSRAR